MIKLSSFLTRRADLTPAEFSRYWTEEHAPFLEKITEIQKYVRRYVQQINISEGLDRSVDAGYDGIAELWFDNKDDFKLFSQTFGAITSVSEDEENFLDRSKTVSMLSDERHGLWTGKG